MPTKIVSVSAYRHLVDKAQITANVGALLAIKGKRVCILDKDIKRPLIHFIFGTDTTENVRAFNDFLISNVELHTLAREVTSQLGDNSTGKLWVIPAREKGIFDVPRENYDITVLDDALFKLSQQLALDFILINTESGTENNTLFATALSDVCLIVMHLDDKDYQGVGVMVDVMNQLNVAQTMLVVSMVEETFELSQVEKEVSASYSVKVAGVLPYSNSLLDMSSKGGIFVKQYPELEIVDRFQRIASLLDHV